ncbi:hypothetical protein K469DRAFT_754653 [Zopfia rhizophila CBS 207.26]|uniref:MFS general substrate transporter n=1 Tax=Zopfia rhizophila CBS 207.26 TaxID=1314779 RepID=A0A6A6DFX5_9PEZI|nr:hypothetical protein K469DRAFT_754653 [Zopfia rhizophila CBS 207.26]
MVFFPWAVVQTVAYYFSLFFQKVQGLSAVDTSVRSLPNVPIGIVLSIVTNMVLHKYSAYWIILCTTFVSAVSPILLAVIELQWLYWYPLFWAILMSSLDGDVIFVVSNLVITNGFPDTTQALVGAVSTPSLSSVPPLASLSWPSFHRL